MAEVLELIPHPRHRGDEFEVLVHELVVLFHDLREDVIEAALEVLHLNVHSIWRWEDTVLDLGSQRVAMAGWGVREAIVLLLLLLQGMSIGRRSVLVQLSLGVTGPSW